MTGHMAQGGGGRGEASSKQLLARVLLLAAIGGARRPTVARALLQPLCPKTLAVLNGHTAAGLTQRFPTAARHGR